MLKRMTLEDVIIYEYEDEIFIGKQAVIIKSLVESLTIYKKLYNKLLEETENKH